MREIKFRGKSYSWHYGDLIHDSCNGRELIFIDNNAERTRHSVDKDTVGQFTGHYDVMGTEIYEGDIVSGYFEEDEWPAEVEWDEVTASFVLIGQCSHIRFDEMDGLEITVIGNVHDNPDLLKVKS